MYWSSLFFLPAECLPWTSAPVWQAAVPADGQHGSPWQRQSARADHVRAVREGREGGAATV